jgi:phosphate transport system permease protein
MTDTSIGAGPSTIHGAQPGLVTPRTHLPRYDDDAAPAFPRTSLGKPTPDERFVNWGSLASAIALAWLVTQRLLPLPGWPWFLVAAFGFTLLIGSVTAAMRGGWPEVADVLVRRVVLWLSIVVAAALVSAIVFVMLRGWRPLVHWNFFTDDMASVGPKSGLEVGGVFHAILGSLIELSIGLAITLPLGIGTAVFMNEVGGGFARIVRTVVEAMTALPSIVAGLFIYSVAIITFHLPPSGLAAGLAIAVMMLPIVARAADVVLRVVPSGLREASLALGASRWKTVWNVVLPTARPGLATAVILGVARGVGETSPVLITSGASTFTVGNPLQIMNSLPLYVFTQVKTGEPMAITRGFGAAAVLITVVLMLFIIARIVSRPPRTKAKAHPVRRTVRGLGRLLTINGAVKALAPRTSNRENA